jgi:hypothetical protein
MANTKTTIKFQPDLRDLRGLLKALNKMDDDSKKALKEDVASISAWTAGAIKTSRICWITYASTDSHCCSNC